MQAITTSEGKKDEKERKEKNVDEAARRLDKRTEKRMHQ